jgi:A/G-specific adenine glycosylase
MKERLIPAGKVDRMEKATRQRRAKNADGNGPDPILIETSVLTRIRRNLLAWYRAHARDLPWRRSRDPYRIWISEIMLQQTTVAAVIPYFERFTESFPTVQSLAAATEHDVLRLWEGLGYYSRARNLRAAAAQIVENHAGILPDDVAALIELPGIGRYTAGAITSLAYDRPAPIVEANTRRVYSRLLGFRGDPHSTSGLNIIWNFAEQAVPKRAPGAFNQGLMDLGATLCIPIEPRCAECPLRTCCRAFLGGLQREIPTARRRPQVTFVTEAMIAVRKRGRFLLWRRPRGARWAGLWEFLRIPLGPDSSNGSANVRQNPRSDGNGTCHLSRQMRTQIENEVAEVSGLCARSDSQGVELRHSVTRFRIQLTCVVAEYCGGTPKASLEFRWVRPSDFGSYALSMPARKFADRLASETKTKATRRLRSDR